MLETLIWTTVAICVAGAVAGYASTRDVFHPALLLAPMCLFIYAYLPLELLQDGVLFNFVTEEQAVFGHTLTVLGLFMLFAGLIAGSRGWRKAAPVLEYSTETLKKGAYTIGLIGLACWVFTIRNAGGITGAFGKAYSSGWSEYGYIRDAVYLLLVALLLLLTPECYRRRDWKWYLAVIAFALPWLAQGLLGARRGPTFVIALTLGMSWYLARRKRPPLALMLGAGAALGCLMLFLVTNRSSIYIGSQTTEFNLDVTDTVTNATEANEYIFGTACITTAKQMDRYFWGKRYLAQVLIRPIPKQLWPDKYADVGLEELLYNAGVGGPELSAVMGWSAVPGAAAAMIADLWVEFSWLYLPVILAIGYSYGAAWRRAVQGSGPWSTQFVILSVLSIYLVTQSGEAVIFRLVMLSLPTWYVWRRARRAATEQVAGALRYSGVSAA